MIGQAGIVCAKKLNTICLNFWCYEIYFQHLGNLTFNCIRKTLIVSMEWIYYKKLCNAIWIMVGWYLLMNFLSGVGVVEQKKYATMANFDMR